LVKRIGQIIIGINDKEIRNRLETPLETSIDIQVVELIIILNKGSEE